MREFHSLVLLAALSSAGCMKGGQVAVPEVPDEIGQQVGAVEAPKEEHPLLHPTGDGEILLGREVYTSESGGWTISDSRAPGCEVTVRREPASYTRTYSADLNKMASLSLGVSAKFVYALAWAIAFMSAGVGGTLLGNINGLNYSVAYLGLLVLPAVVFGGLNSVPGAIVGGITIGLIQNLAGGYIDDLTIAGVRIFPGGVKEVAPYIFMVIILLFKPYGLWGWVRIERV